MIRLLVVTVMGLFGFLVSAHGYCLQTPRDIAYREWSGLVYYGKMTNDNLGNVMALKFSLNDDTLYSLELAKELSPLNPVRRFFQPIVSSVDFRTNVTFLKDNYGNIAEITPYFTLNWYHFPWSHCLPTIFSIGEGISYVSKVPYAEEQNSDQPKKLLNFLLCELGFAIPCHPQWEFIARIHHRSGAYGLYYANNSGSTAIGFAIRYYFN